MVGGEEVVVLWLRVLPWLGLSFTRVRRSREGALVGGASKVHLVVNAVFGGVFLALWARVSSAGGRFKASAFVYSYYVELMALGVVALVICGNLRSRGLVGVAEALARVKRGLERDLGPLQERGKGRWGQVVGFFVCLGATTGLGLWTEAHLAVNCDSKFRVIQCFCSSYVALSAEVFVATMEYVKEEFGGVKGAFGKILKGKGSQGRRLRAWMAGYMELREVERLLYQVFGMQIFLILFLAFSSATVNAYYLAALNLYGKSHSWLNLRMGLGFLQAAAVVLWATRAAEQAADEANKINRIIFAFPVHLVNWQMHNQVQCFALFSCSHPVQFKAWVFYGITYGSLYKVVLTSAAVITVILQCDFLRGSLESGFEGSSSGSDLTCIISE